MSDLEIARLKNNALSSALLHDAVDVISWCDEEVALRKAQRRPPGERQAGRESNLKIEARNLPEEINALAEEIWTLIDLKEPFPWPKSPKSRLKICNQLENLIGDLKSSEIKINELKFIDDNETFNIELRRVISPNILKRDDDRSRDIAAWIVREWGGIRAGNDVFSIWIADLRLKGLNDFASAMGVKRISSWSKILAFADPENHAIYDSRTALALNYGLATLGRRERFFVPPSQNKIISAASQFLASKQTEMLLAYDAYISLLKRISDVSGLSSILQVEMALFANAPRLAKDLIDRCQQCHPA